MKECARYWNGVLSRARENASPEKARDFSALCAVGAMISALECRGRVPAPTPELCAALAWAEVLAA